MVKLLKYEVTYWSTGGENRYHTLWLGGECQFYLCTHWVFIWASHQQQVKMPSVHPTSFNTWPVPAPLTTRKIHFPHHAYKIHSNIQAMYVCMYVILILCRIAPSARNGRSSWRSSKKETVQTSVRYCRRAMTLYRTKKHTNMTYNTL